MCGRLALYIDNNRARQEQIVLCLKSIPLKLHRAGTLPAAKRLAGKYNYRLVLVDYPTVGPAIFDFCSWVHSYNMDSIIVVMLEKVQTEIEQRLFECGANDVVVGQQACPAVLAKRIQVRLSSSKSIWRKGGMVKINSTIIDFDRREVWCNGKMRRLPGILADLLKYFIDNPNRVISRKELQNCPIWADSICTPADEGGKTFDVNVSKLRKIIEPDPAKPKIIKSVRGMGWKLVHD